MYCFEIDDFLKETNVPIIIVDTGKATLALEHYLKDKHSDIYNRISFFMDDNYNRVKMSKDVLPICKHIGDFLYVIVGIKPSSVSSMEARLIDGGVDKDKIFKLFPFYPLTRKIWDILSGKTKLKIIECGARGGNPNTARIRHFCGYDNVITIGFDPDQNECDELNKIDNYKAYPYIVDEQTGKTRTMYQILQNGCVTFYKPNQEVLQRLITTDKSNPLKIFREFNIVNTISLDDWLLREQEDVDYLIINVDSAEYHVLNGAENLLKKYANCVEVETHLGFFFDDAPSFSDIDRLMKKSECFELIDFNTPMLLHVAKSPFMFDAKKLIHYNAFYCKTVANLIENNDQFFKLLKTISILEILDYQELAFDLLISAYESIIKNQDASNAKILREVIEYGYTQYATVLVPSRTLQEIVSPPVH